MTSCVSRVIDKVANGNQGCDTEFTNGVASSVSSRRPAKEPKETSYVTSRSISGTEMTTTINSFRDI
jgi:hypothetical protein